jgi:hypothetical protein
MGKNFASYLLGDLGQDTTPHRETHTPFDLSNVMLVPNADAPHLMIGYILINPLELKMH